MGKRKIPPTRAGSGAAGEVHAALLNRGEKCGLVFTCIPEIGVK
jgi:hypothetical protein